MTVDIERPDGSAACVVRVSGDMDLSVVPEVREAVDSAIASGCTSIVLDLASVTYADSTALGLIVWLDRQLVPLHGRLVLAGADHNVSRVLELSGLVGLAPSLIVAADARAAVEAIELPETSDTPLWEKSIIVPARVEEMSHVRTAVCDLVAPLGLAEPAVFDLRVAVGEALANAVRHGSPRGENDKIGVTVAAYHDRVVVSVADAGEGFDEAPGPTDDVYASGGRGIMFMRALMDRVEFSNPKGEGTVVRLTKRLPAGLIGGVDAVGA